MKITKHLRRLLASDPDLVDIQRAEIVRLRASNDELRAVNRRLRGQVELAFQRGQLLEHTRASGATLAYLSHPLTGGRLVVEASPTVAGGAAR